MTLLPMNARSELVLPRNFSEGGVFESTRRFHVASAAFIKPARSPTRGSGLGAAADMPPGEEDALAHAAADTSATASDNLRSEVAWGIRAVEREGVIMASFLR